MHDSQLMAQDPKWAAGDFEWLPVQLKKRGNILLVLQLQLVMTSVCKL